MISARTSGRWIVDQQGVRVKLVCVNWAGAEVKAPWGPWRERGSPAIELEDVGRLPQLKRTKSGVAADWVIVCLHKNQMVGQMEDPSCI